MENINIDMWYGDKFQKKKFGADAYFNSSGYAGNIYNENGKRIGDYTAENSQIIEECFNIGWRN